MLVTELAMENTLFAQIQQKNKLLPHKRKQIWNFGENRWNLISLKMLQLQNWDMQVFGQLVLWYICLHFAYPSVSNKWIIISGMEVVQRSMCSLY